MRKEYFDGHWLEADKAALNDAQTFEDLLAIAMRIIGRMPDGIINIVCGPITSGGAGSIEKNLAIFDAMIRYLRDVKGRLVFTQLPFEEAMARIKNLPYYRGENHLLTAFYRPIFRACANADRLLLHFLPGWETSGGATWEHDEAVSCGWPRVGYARLPEAFPPIT